jgi:hypothetical protein
MKKHYNFCGFIVFTTKNRQIFLSLKINNLVFCEVVLKILVKLDDAMVGDKQVSF